MFEYKFFIDKPFPVLENSWNVYGCLKFAYLSFFRGTSSVTAKKKNI